MKYARRRMVAAAKLRLLVEKLDEGLSRTIVQVSRSLYASKVLRVVMRSSCLPFRYTLDVQGALLTNCNIDDCGENSPISKVGF